MMESPKAERGAMVRRVLGVAEHRPSIVYVPTRAEAEELARRISERHAALPYHAGLAKEQRARAQEAFLSGEVEIIVATVAFGMGIDKADVRTVVHTALPGSVEAYYQEIGRAGRDGKPSRAVLLWSWGDRKVHECFFEKAWPEPGRLARLLHRVPARGIPREDLLEQIGRADEVENAIERLWAHGALLVDEQDVVRPGRADWVEAYEAVRTYRRRQIDEMLELVRSTECRMLELVRFFGEHRDEIPCRHCDRCAPQGCVARVYRPPTPGEALLARRIIDALLLRDGLTVGQLFESLEPGGGIDRRGLERIVDALHQARLVRATRQSFEKDGEVINFRRVYLERGARLLDPQAQLRVEGEHSGAEKRPARPTTRRKAAVARGDEKNKNKEPASRPRKAGAEPTGLESSLRAWRLEEARKRKVPPFIVLQDSVLHEIVEARPMSEWELLQVRGMGPKLVSRVGEAILAIVKAST
jgi:DNA topoisomerase-3